MARSYASGIVAAPVDDVWRLVRRFDGLPEWHPFVETCDMVDGADPAAVGAHRRQRLANGGVARARLAGLDDEHRSLVYEMLDGPWPVRNYLATIRVFPITTTGDTFVEWSGRYDADAAVEPELAHDFGVATYDAGVRALQEWFATTRPKA
ncbi:MAG TPA: SRPBCC family protein [Baekduia sp.]|uniref:SRPBCC family protein n=1 Tax=Baekduia sp. TaxID=2600305 RepID=UPI002D78F1A4|nr:SRPBCC family protein [Baekduia sp.]HET6509067.1 SRPBCC family protein [Baekduia sp.]